MTPVLGLVVAVTLAQTPQPAQIPPPQPGAPTARLAGRVTVEGTNAPLADARVVLVFALRRMPQRPMFPIGPPPQATTDQDGRFAFPHLRPGEYRVEVQKTGYAPLDEAGQGRTIELADGQSIDNLQVPMQKGAVISGRILAPNGEPQTDVLVLAMRRVSGPPAAPNPRLVPVPMQGSQQTNDIGEFRIAGLAPGEYFVSAAPRGQSPFGGPGVELPAATASRTTLTATYYPGTIDIAAAQPIAVARGAEVGNISFTLQAAPAFRVSGIVVDEDGNPVGGAMVTLMRDPRGGTFMPGPPAGGQSTTNGRFTIGSVVAGTYRANASLPVRMNPGGVASWSSSGGSSGSTVVTGGLVNGATTTAVGGAIHEPIEIVVGDSDITGVRIVVRKPQ